MTKSHIALKFLLVLSLISCSEKPLFQGLSQGDELIMLTRESPTTYYLDNNQPTGFEYELMQAFAKSHGYKLRVKVASSLEELLGMINDQAGHVAAAGLAMTPNRNKYFIASDAYISQQPLIIYKSGLLRPRSLQDLEGRDIVVLAGSSHIDTLKSLSKSLPKLRWRDIPAANTLKLMQLLTEEKADIAIIDSLEFRVQQQLYPRLIAALELETHQDIVWYLPNIDGAKDFAVQINEFLMEKQASGEFDRLQKQFFGGTKRISRINTFTLQQKIRSELPKWQSLIQEIAEEYQMDWRLLAAISYQESHWNPEAVSITGVRGMMMITCSTAEELGIEDRTDPRQSLQGGARFLKNLLRRLPSDINEPDRTWMALAAYNIGIGHLEDARVLAESAGLDPHLWQDTRKYLPALQNPKIYPTTRYGFARGREAVTYVDNIQHYYSVLRLTTAIHPKKIMMNKSPT